MFQTKQKVFKIGIILLGMCLRMSENVFKFEITRNMAFSKCYNMNDYDGDIITCFSTLLII